jgi:hypothetical protein
MPKLVNKGYYYELQEDSSAIWANVLNGMARTLQGTVQAIQDKRVREQKEQEARLDLQAKINSLDPDIQRSLLEGSPEMRRFLIDPKLLKQDQEQRKALERGDIVPMMPKIRKRTPLEQATLFERQESGRRETALANKAEQEALLQTDVTGSRRNLMQSENPYEQILGLTGEVLTTDKLEALMTGVNDPEGRAPFNKYMSGVPGTAQFKEQMRQKTEAQLLSEINPQNPEEMQGVRDIANYVAGLGAMPRKMPKNMQRRAQDLDAWRIRVQEQGNQISQTRLNMETNAKIHALGDSLSIRLKGTGRESSAFAIAEGMIRGGKFPSDLPPDIMALAEQESKLVNINMDKLKYEHELQKAPKLQMLLEMAAKSATAGDDKGAQNYIKMAEEERKKLYGEDKPDPNERKRFWNTVITTAAGISGPMGTAMMPVLANTTIEQKAAMLKWTGATVAEISEFMTTTVPYAAKSAAAKGMITSPGQAQLPGGVGVQVAPLPKRIPAAPPPTTKEKSSVAADGSYVAPAGSPSVQSLPGEQVQAIENMLRDIDKLSIDTMTPQKRDELLTLLQMIEEVKEGKRPFVDLITPDR